MPTTNRQKGGRTPRSGETGTPKAIFRQPGVSSHREQEESRRPLSQLSGRELERALREQYPKRIWQPSVMMMPNPVVLVSCGGKNGFKADVLTVAWAGIVNTEPPMISISIRPERYSHDIIAETKEFVVNLPRSSQAKIVDWCGMKSGRDVDKFAEMKLNVVPGEHVKCPVILDCPVNLECQVSKIIPLGSHDLFLAKIVGVWVSEDAVDKKGCFRAELADVLGYAHGTYFELGKRLGQFGFSVRKHK